MQHEQGLDQGMKNLKARVAKHLGYVALTFLVFLALNWVNELIFIQFEHTKGINWMFIPAGIRLLATLLFGLAGFEGLLLAGLYLNFHHFHFDSEFRAWSGAVAGALGPYLASLFAKHWFDLRARLKGLTPQRLLFTGVLCGLMSPIFHHALMWVLTGSVDWNALAVMIVGDTLGILVVLTIAKGVFALSDRNGPIAGLLRRWTP
jgi:uncharacterized membrane protein